MYLNEITEEIENGCRVARLSWGIVESEYWKFHEYMELTNADLMANDWELDKQDAKRKKRKEE